MLSGRGQVKLLHRPRVSVSTHHQPQNITLFRAQLLELSETLTRCWDVQFEQRYPQYFLVLVAIGSTNYCESTGFQHICPNRFHSTRLIQLVDAMPSKSFKRRRIQPESPAPDSQEHVATIATPDSAAAREASVESLDVYLDNQMNRACLSHGSSDGNAAREKFVDVACEALAGVDPSLIEQLFVYLLHQNAENRAERKRLVTKVKTAFDDDSKFRRNPRDSNKLIAKYKAIRQCHDVSKLEEQLSTATRTAAEIRARLHAITRCNQTSWKLQGALKASIENADLPPLSSSILSNELYSFASSGELDFSADGDAPEDADADAEETVAEPFSFIGLLQMLRDGRL